MARTKKSKEKNLEDLLFDCRNALRGKVEQADNRNAVMGLVFLKFAGDKFQRRREEIIKEYDDIPIFVDKPSFYLSQNVFYLEEHCRWAYIVDHASDTGIANILDQAMADIEKDNPDALKGALPQRFFTRINVGTPTLKTLIDTINRIDETRFEEKDLIGRVYEYFLQHFAIDERKEKGEFYTPKCLVNLIAELIEPYHGKILDPCCGSGGMFVQSVQFIQAHHGDKLDVSVYGQESNPGTFQLAKMNLAIRGISSNLGERHASSFTDDQHPTLKVDYIMANPPFNLKNWRDEDELLTDARWSGYQVPPVSNANYAWILHMLAKLDETDGIAGFLLSNGALNSGGEEAQIRKQLIENDKVEAIFVLPREMFYSTDISVSLWIINNNKKARTLNGRSLRNREHEVLFVDLRSWNESIYEKKYVMFDETTIGRIRDIYFAWQSSNEEAYVDVPELCYSAGVDEIRTNSYTLAPSKYIKFLYNEDSKDPSARVEDYKSAALEALQEAKALGSEASVLQSRISALFGDIALGKHSVTYKPIGSIIQTVDERNVTGDELAFLGMNRDKSFMPTAATTEGLDPKKYKLLRSGRFAYTGMQTGRDKCIRIALYDSNVPALISPAYTTFEIVDADVLPAYFHALFLDSQMDRLGWFLSDTSVRSNLDWPEFCSIEIPVPSKEVQELIISLRSTKLMVCEIQKSLDALELDYVPAVVRSIESGTLR